MIIRLVEAGFSEGIIIKRIQESPVDFDLYPLSSTNGTRNESLIRIVAAMAAAMEKTGTSESTGFSGKSGVFLNPSSSHPFEHQASRNKGYLIFGSFCSSQLFSCLSSAYSLSAKSRESAPPSGGWTPVIHISNGALITVGIML